MKSSLTSNLAKLQTLIYHIEEYYQKLFKKKNYSMRSSLTSNLSENFKTGKASNFDSPQRGVVSNTILKKLFYEIILFFKLVRQL